MSQIRREPEEFPEEYDPRRNKSILQRLAAARRKVMAEFRGTVRQEEPKDVEPPEDRYPD